MSKLCDYREDRRRGTGYRCIRCGDHTDNPNLRRVCPVLRGGPSGGQRWSFGVTTTPQRIHDGQLTRTLDSLAAAGFGDPIVFVDGSHGEAAGVPRASHRAVLLGAYGNWIVAAWELYLRSPYAERYAIFQDDLEAAAGLRHYLEQCTYPRRGYWNLYAAPENCDLLAGRPSGWHRSNQRGLGALGLVFDNRTLRLLLADRHMVRRVRDERRGRKNIDGAVLWALRRHGVREYVHRPGLLQHTDEVSTLGHQAERRSPCFEPQVPAIAWRCMACGARRTIAELPVRCECGLVQFEHPAGLGDRVAAILGRFGVTERRYNRWRSAVRLRGPCRCKDRQQLLNRVTRSRWPSWRRVARALFSR